MAELCETMTFIILGVSLYSILEYMSMSYSLIFFSILVIFIARILTVIPCCALLNSKRKEKINSKTQLVLCWSGLRGGMAYALSIEAMDSLNDKTQAKLMVAMTSAYIIFSVYIVGVTLAPILKAFHMFGVESKPIPISIYILFIINIHLYYF